MISFPGRITLPSLPAGVSSPGFDAHRAFRILRLPFREMRLQPLRRAPMAGTFAERLSVGPTEFLRGM
jgi:hypothetical protein